MSNFVGREAEILKKYAAELDHKKMVFAAKTATSKTLFLTLMTNFGVKKNDYFYNTVQKELTADVLFE